MVERNLSVSGKMINFRTNIGSIVRHLQEGGSQAVYVSLKTPFKVGEEVTHRLEYDAIDTFTETNESIAAKVFSKTKKTSIHVNFPEKRRPKNIHGFYLFNDEVTEIPEALQSHNNNRVYTLEFKNPKLGSKLLIEWDW